MVDDSFYITETCIIQRSIHDFFRKWKASATLYKKQLISAKRICLHTYCVIVCSSEILWNLLSEREAHFIILFNGFYHRDTFYTRCSWNYIVARNKAFVALSMCIWFLYYLEEVICKILISFSISSSIKGDLIHFPIY